ncbi:hypothetical protein [Microbulbifer sp. PSTR4-B]|uniref:hypothetical protein n=1 Tax=Microbulbifer sp. PSTR4-B TaxID=3243396 RepID=UPI0040393A1E
MKLNKLIILTAAMCISGMTQASVMENEFSAEVGGFKVKQLRENAEFGIFKVEHSLARVPSSIAAPDQTVTTTGQIAIVNIDKNSERGIVGKGTIVRNTITGELTTLTGNVTVLLSKNVTASEVAEATGMKVLSVFPGTDIAILKIKEGNDLLEAFNAIKRSGLTIESRVEVTETMHKAQ